MIRILIVEDEIPISDLLKITLSGEGYSCVCAYDGLKASEILAKEQFDLVLLDVMLPGIDGFELMEYIRSIATPVIFITAKSAVADRVRGLKLGAEDYIIKPFDLLELLARVEGVLRRHGKLDDTICIGGLTINVKSMTVLRDGIEIPLTKRNMRSFYCSPEILELCCTKARSTNGSGEMTIRTAPGRWSSMSSG